MGGKAGGCWGVGCAVGAPALLTCPSFCGPPQCLHTLPHRPTPAPPSPLGCRLTQNVIDGFGVSGAEGVYRRVCEITLSVLRQHKGSILRWASVCLHCCCGLPLLLPPPLPPPLPPDCSVTRHKEQQCSCVSW